MEVDKPEESEKVDEKKEDEGPKPLGLADVKSTVAMIEEAVQKKESRIMFRALRTLVQMRSELTEKFVVTAADYVFGPCSAKREAVVALFPSWQTEVGMDVDEEAPTEGARKDKTHDDILEVEVFVKLMVTTLLMDQKRTSDALALTQELIDSFDGNNDSQRSLDPLSARAYFYWARCHELLEKNYAQIRKRLLVAHRTATIKHNEIGQATIHNLLMRNYLAANLLEQADNFNSKTNFPEVNLNETARHMYYVGRIRAVQLEYSEAYFLLMQACRKAPQSKARGFRATVNKLLSIVRLLMGEVPERKFYNQPGIAEDLEPYCAIAGAVRLGDLADFNKATTQYSSVFLEDKNQNLIVRLRHNVIKAGLKKMNVSYSRISLSDICTKLSLDSIEATECVVAKAIRDGVIDGIVDHAAGYLQSNETIDVYSTTEPQEAFKKRIRFCLDIHNEAVMAMRYPEDAQQASFETAEERLAREKEESELAKTLREEDEEDEM